MIGTLIIIVVVVAVLARGRWDGRRRSRSRRRSDGGTADRRRHRPRRRSPPPQAPSTTPDADTGRHDAPSPRLSQHRRPKPSPRLLGAPPTYRSRLGSVRGLFSGAVVRAAVGPDRRGHLGVAGGGADPGRRRRRPRRTRCSTTCGPRWRPRRSAAATTCSRRWARRSVSCSTRSGRAPLRFDGRAGPSRRLADRRRERRGQDDDHRQAGPAPVGRRPLGAPGRGRHLPGRRGRPARHVGRAHRDRDRPGRRGRRPERRSSSTPSSAPRRGATTSCWPTRRDACTRRSTSSRS